MLTINGSRLLASHAKLAKAGQFLASLLSGQITQASVVDPTTFSYLEEAARELSAECKALALDTSILALDKLIGQIEGLEKSDDSTLNFVALRSLDQRLNYVHSVVSDELKSRFLFSVKADYSQFLTETDGSQFGQEVADTFPSSLYDIEGASRCLALGQNTACVFHLMRACEAAVAIIAGRIGATVKNKHEETLPWAILVSNIKCEIEGMPRGQKQDEWLKVHSLLHSCNRAYRTKTAHPADKYSEQEAVAAWHATRSFMQEFASLLSR